MMKLSDLIHRNNWVNVETTFRKLYQLDEEVVNAHRDVYENLVQLVEQTSDLQLEIRHIKNDDEEYHEVCGIKKVTENGEKKSEAYAIEFKSWSEWLGMPITTYTEKNYNELEIISHCLYEMTFVGFTEEKIQHEWTKLKSTIEELEQMSDEERQKNTISLDDMLKKFGIEK